MDATDPYSAVRTVLSQFPTDEKAKDSMERRDIEAQRIHFLTLNIVEQLNSLKPSYSGQMNTNATEKDCLMDTLDALKRDTEKKKLYLKEKEIELEDLQLLSEVQRSIMNERKRQFESIKVFEVENKESLIENTTGMITGNFKNTSFLT